jgi:hypothetical protein
MGFVGPWNIFTIASSDLVKRVADWASLTTSINTALSTVAQSVTDLGPGWAPQRSVPAAGDLNTYTTPGVSRISTPDTGTIANMPPGTRVASEVENITTGTGSDSIFVQKLTESGDGGRQFWRPKFTSGGTFGPWAYPGCASVPVTEWHVFLAVGQSNMSGRGIVSTAAGGKYMQTRIAQFGYTRRVLETATVPLDMHDTSSGLSPASVFANAYLKNQPDHVGVLLIPAAHGGTGFTTSTTTQTWTPGITTNPLYDLPGQAVKQVNDALAAVAAAGTTVTASLKGILWHQGEDNGSMSTATYATNLDALISYFRTQFGNLALPFVLGQMVPEGIAANSPGRANIDLAHQQTPNRVKYTALAPARSNGYNPGDTTHMSQLGVDYLGRGYMEAFEAAKRNTEGVITWAETAGRQATMYNHATAAVQTFYGDTGERDVSALSSNTTGQIKLRRVGSLVELHLDGVAPTADAAQLDMLTLPLGFRPVGSGGRRYWVVASAAALLRSGYVYGAGIVRIFNAVAATDSYRHTYTFSTADAWPSSLPGSALGTIPN